MSVPLPNPVPFDEAVRLLKAGEVCAFPTETVYGLGADATRAEAVLKIYQTKQRPRFNPLIVHCADLDMARAIGVFDPTAEKLADLWPGPLTLLMPLRAEAGISDLVTAGLTSVGLRIPASALARDLIAAVGKPLAAPSANPSGRISPTNAGQVRALFDDGLPVLDGGPCQTGVESTIIAVDGGQVVQLRAGGLPRDLIEDHVGEKIAQAEADSAVRAPGMLKSHYAPRAQLRLNAQSPKAGEGWLGFGAGDQKAEHSRNLSPAGELAEAARNLFAYLHELDAPGVNMIAVAPIPETGLGEAINDRLRRAAAPR